MSTRFITSSLQTKLPISTSSHESRLPWDFSQHEVKDRRWREEFPSMVFLFFNTTLGTTPLEYDESRYLGCVSDGREIL